MAQGGINIKYDPAYDRPLPATAYSTYSQLPSMLESVSSLRNLRTIHVMMTGLHIIEFSFQNYLSNISIFILYGGEG